MSAAYKKRVLNKVKKSIKTSAKQAVENNQPNIQISESTFEMFKQLAIQKIKNGGL